MLIFEICQRFRNHEVSIFVLNVLQPIFSDFVDDDFSILWFISILYEHLHDAETLFICCQLLKLLTYLLKDIISSILFKRFNDLLDHVLALDIFSKFADVIILDESFFDEIEFFLLGYELDDVL
jgi:hypothetical protein